MATDEKNTAPAKPRNNYKNIVYLGLVSFFSGLSQEMLTPILPLFLTASLGFNKEFVGLVSGLVVSVSSFFKIFSGYVSDKLQKRKWIIFAGYFLSAAARPLLGAFNAGAQIIGLRLTDAVGKGVKDSPRDALVAESSPAGKTGRSFGLHRMLDTLGSVAGPFIVFFLLWFLANDPEKYKKIFFLTAIPGLIALLVIVIFVRETPKLQTARVAPDFQKSPPKLGKNFYFLLFAIVIFSLGNSTDAFLLLRAQNLGLSVLAIPIVYALFYLFYALLSYPIGALSDKVGKRPMIIFGWFIYVIVYLGFALASRGWQVWPLFILYGLFYAATEGSGRALTADIINPAHHGLAFGLYNAAIAVTALPASVFVGYLWDKYSPAAAFHLGWITAAAALVLFGVHFFVSKKELKSS